MNDLTILEDGSNNSANIYTDSEAGANPHQFYLFNTGQTSLQDLDIKIKVKLPEDFVDFTSATTDLSFFYKNVGVDNTDSKIDILVEDNDGDDAFTAVDGQGLFNIIWTEYTDEFDGLNFNPSAGESVVPSKFLRQRDDTSRTSSARALRYSSLIASSCWA